MDQKGNLQLRRPVPSAYKVPRKEHFWFSCWVTPPPQKKRYTIGESKWEFWMQFFLIEELLEIVVKVFQSIKLKVI